MGTNYYLNIPAAPPCSACGHSSMPEMRIHIGKSSSGWMFALHVYPTGIEADPYERRYDRSAPIDPSVVINGLADWHALFVKYPRAIEDEYGRSISSEEMIDTITKRSHPTGLRCHAPEPGRCLGPGAGTWDLLVGWFS